MAEPVTRRLPSPNSRWIIAPDTTRSLAKIDLVRDAAAGAAQLPHGQTSGSTVANCGSRTVQTRTLEASEREHVASRHISP